MSENDKIRNFSDLITKQKRIVIPKIQRGYAEGRENIDVENTRKLFLGMILGRITGSAGTEEEHINVVYGIKDEGKGFIPLDGQQRLTTLFLLRWFFDPAGSDSSLLCSGDKSVFSYEARDIATDFCNTLVKKNAREIIGEYCKTSAYTKYLEEFEKKEKKEARNQKEDIATRYSKDPYSFYSYFINRNSWSCRYDSTVKSMIVVLNTIIDYLIKNGKINDYILDKDGFIKKTCDNLARIVFDFLDLEELSQPEKENEEGRTKKLEQLSDELYIKMNSRGKPLNKYDNLKGKIEEEIINDSAYEKWMDKIEDIFTYFWNREEIRNRSCSDRADKAEEMMRTLFLYLASTQKRNYNGKEFSNYSVSKKDTIQRYIISDDKNIIDVDYNKLVDDTLNLFYEDDSGELHFATELLEKNIAWHPEKEQKEITQVMMEQLNTDSVSIKRGTAVLLFSMVSFLSEKGFSAPECYKEKSKRDAFNFWIRYMCSMYMPENRGDYDDNDDANQAFKEITETKHKTDLKKSKDEKTRFIYEKRAGNDRKWIDVLDEAESDDYLLHNIFFLLEWSKLNNGYDPERFREYYSLFKGLKAFVSDKNNLGLYYDGFILNDNSQGENHKMLMVEGFDRDDSLKAHIRNHEGGQYLKPVFDFMINKKESDIEKGFKEYIEGNRKNIKADDWRFFFLNTNDWYGNYEKCDRMRTYVDTSNITYYVKKEKIGEDDITEVAFDYLISKWKKKMSQDGSEIKRNAKNKIEVKNKNTSYEISAKGSYEYAIDGKDYGLCDMLAKVKGDCNI